MSNLDRNDNDDLNFDAERQRDRGAPERLRAQQSYQRATRPKRRGASVSFNGIHRRRKKRVQW